MRAVGSNPLIITLEAEKLSGLAQAVFLTETATSTWKRELLQDRRLQIRGNDMHLKVYTDVAMRAALYLGQQPGQWSSITEIASATGTSRSHLIKVVHDLAAAGFLQSARGYNGGVRLGAPPEQINVGQLIRHAERSWQLLDCAACQMALCCGFSPILNEAMTAFFKVLDGYTLADVLARGGAGVPDSDELHRQPMFAVLGVKEAGQGQGCPGAGHLERDPH